MANRLNAPNTFEGISPPWLLSQLDANATQNQAAWNDSSLGFVNGIPADTGSANAYAISLPFGSPSALNSGFTCFFIPANTNTGASTLTVSPLGSAAILTPAGNALQGGEINANAMLGLVYSTVVPVGFRILGACGLSISLSSSVDQTINCAGYTSITAAVSYTTTSRVTTLNNVGMGVPIFLQIHNQAGAAGIYSIAMTNASGGGVVCIAVNAGGANGNFGFNITSGTGFFNLSSGATSNLYGGLITTGLAEFGR